MTGLLAYDLTSVTAWPMEASAIARYLDVPWYREMLWPVALRDDHTETVSHHFWKPVKAAECDPRAAFEALFRVYYPRMVGVLSVRWGQEIAEEAVSEAWIAAWVRLVHIMQAGLVPGLYDKPVSWLYKVANQRACRLWLRSRRSQEPLDAVNELASGDVTERDVVNRLDIGNALARLPGRQRQVLVLYYFCGYNVDEASQRLGVAAETVRSTMSQGRTRLRKLLSGSDDGTCVKDPSRKAVRRR